jgi:hypothetical protein
VPQVRYAVSERFKQLDVMHRLLHSAGLNLQIVRLPEKSVVDRCVHAACT